MGHLHKTNNVLHYILVIILYCVWVVGGALLLCYFNLYTKLQQSLFISNFKATSFKQPLPFVITSIYCKGKFVYLVTVHYGILLKFWDLKEDPDEW